MFPATGRNPALRSTRVRYGDLEVKIAQLQGVEAARVVHANGHVSEVHVLASPGKPAKQVVRDVQSLAMAAFDLAVDHRVVSVVQIEADRLGTVHRASLADIREVADGPRVTLHVSITWHNEVYTGIASGPASHETRPRLCGEATLDAVEQLVGDEVAAALANIEQVTIGGRTIMLAVVVLVSSGSEQTLIGAALVQSDPAPAAVKAVLDALNRQVPQIEG